eukprot:scaffold48583_cov66-Phaeocystis_antarctica.AAC.4
MSRGSRSPTVNRSTPGASGPGAARPSVSAPLRVAAAAARPPPDGDSTDAGSIDDRSGLSGGGPHRRPRHAPRCPRGGVPRHAAAAEGEAAADPRLTIRLRRRWQLYQDARGLTHGIALCKHQRRAQTVEAAGGIAARKAGRQRAGGLQCASERAVGGAGRSLLVDAHQRRKIAHMVVHALKVQRLRTAHRAEGVQADHVEPLAEACEGTHVRIQRAQIGQTGQLDEQVAQAGAGDARGPVRRPRLERAQADAERRGELLELGSLERCANVGRELLHEDHRLSSSPAVASAAGRLFDAEAHLASACMQLALASAAEAPAGVQQAKAGDGGVAAQVDLRQRRHVAERDRHRG